MLLIFQCLAKKLRDGIVAERLQDINAAAGEERGDDLKGGILGGCADEADGPALDVGEKCILLGLVEAVNFIDEENRTRVHLSGLCGCGHHLLDLLDAAHDGGKFDEVGFGGFGNDFGQRGFAYAGWTPENH